MAIPCPGFIGYDSLDGKQRTRKLGEAKAQGSWTDIVVTRLARALLLIGQLGISVAQFGSSAAGTCIAIPAACFFGTKRPETNGRVSLLSPKQRMWDGRNAIHL
jgi:hypothetical protein